MTLFSTRPRLVRACRIAAALVALLAPFGAKASEPDGKALYGKWCAICHSPGPMKAGLVALQLKYQDSKPADLEMRTDLSVELIKTMARRGSGIMAPFRKTELSDSELAAIASYLTRSH